MRRAAMLLTILCCWAGLGAAEGDTGDDIEFPEAAAQSVQIVDEICNQYLDFQSHTQTVQGKIGDITATDQLLRAAIAGKNPKKAIEALGKWKPEWAEQLGRLDDYQQLKAFISRHQISLPGLDKAIAAGDRLEELANRAVLAAAGKAQGQTAKLTAWLQSSGISTYLDNATKGDNALGRAIAMGEQVKTAYKRLVQDYGGQAKQFVGLVHQFRRQDDNAYAGLETIAYVLETFKGLAPRPIDEFLGNYATITKGCIDRLKQLEGQIDTNIRQGFIHGNLQKKNTEVVEAIDRQFRDDDSFDVVEIGEPPAPFKGHFFRSLKTGYRYLWTPDKRLVRFTCDDATIARVVDWVTAIKGADMVDPAAIAGYANKLRQRMERFGPEYAPLHQCFRGNNYPLLMEYAKTIAYDGPDELARFDQRIKQAKRSTFENGLAWYMFDSAHRRDLKRLHEQMTTYALVEVSVSLPADTAPPALHLGKLGYNGKVRNIVAMTGDGAGRYRSWFMSFNIDTTIVVTGTSDGRPIPAVKRKLPPLPCRVELAVTLPPADHDDEGSDDGPARADDSDPDGSDPDDSNPDDQTDPENENGPDDQTDPENGDESADDDQTPPQTADENPHQDEDEDTAPEAPEDEVEPAAPPATGSLAISAPSSVEHMKMVGISVNVPAGFTAPITVSSDLREGLLSGLTGSSTSGSFIGFAETEPTHTWIAVTVTDAEGRSASGRITITVTPAATAAGATDDDQQEHDAGAEEDEDRQTVTDGTDEEVPDDDIWGEIATHSDDQVAAEQPQEIVQRDQSAAIRDHLQRQRQQQQRQQGQAQRQQADQDRRRAIREQEIAAFEDAWDDQFAQPEALSEGTVEGEYGVLVDSGGFGITNVTYKSGVSARRLVLTYDCYGIPDQMQVLINGAPILITPTKPDPQYADKVGANFCSGSGTLRSQPLNASPGSVVVRVNGIINGTSWSFTLSQE